MAFDPKKIADELLWLKANPQFEERPASITEFLGEEYLNIEKGVRPGIKAELIELFGDTTNPQRISRYRWAMFSGAIGIGKTTMASIILPYMSHWVLCLKDPQDFYDLLPGSRIALMQMSTSEDQAVETVFGDIKARIEHSKWFVENYPFDPKFTKQIRFSKDIWILPGNSQETTFEGYNILGGILDEADSHKQTKEKDYAEVGFDTINSRIESRYQDRGFLLVVGQMKKANGFAKKKYEELKKSSEAHTVLMTIWESIGWSKFLNPDGTRNSFWYDSKRKEIVRSELASMIGAEAKNLIEIPTVYRSNFENNPEKALRDLAGIPPAAGDPFISLTYKLDEAVSRWQIRNHNIGSPVTTDPVRPQFEKWFTALNSLKRAVHIDLAYSGAGDALGLAMGHVSEMVDLDSELKPYIVFDFLLRMKAPAGTQIMIQDIRRIIYDLKDELGFKIRTVSMDGFQSTDTMQQLRKKRYNVEYLSVDRSKLPYEDLRDAIYENRIEFPPYMTYLNKGSTELVQIAVKELMELEDNDKKVDHPASGSKDVADAMAGVVNSLMGDRVYRRGVGSNRQLTDDYSDDSSNSGKQDSGSEAKRLQDMLQGGLKTQVPPLINLGSGVDLSMPIPPRLMPGR